MRHFLKNTLWVLLSLSAGLCCKKDDTAVGNQLPTDNRELIPLKVGNKWVAHSTTYNPGGTIIADRADSLEFLADTVMQGQHWFNMSNVTLVGKKSDGVWFWNGSNPAELVFKFPAVPNEVYQTSAGQAVVLSINTRITVPCGTYSCYVYKRPFGFGGNQYHYIVPDSGIVKIEAFEISGQNQTYQSWKWELTRLVLN